MTPREFDGAWRCNCGAGHFLTIACWDMARDGSGAVEFEALLQLEGDFRTSWRDRIRQAWEVLRGGCSDTRVGIVLDARVAGEIAAVLVDISDKFDPPGDHGPVTLP